MRLLRVVALAACAWLVAPDSEAQAVKGLSQTDVGKINEVGQVAMKAAVANDHASWAALFLEDAVLNPPHEPAVKGRAAIQAWLGKLPPITAFKLNPVQVEGCDDLAYVLGTYTMTMAPPGAPGPVTDSGKYVEISRRQSDGRWLVAVDIFNSDLAIPAPK